MGAINDKPEMWSALTNGASPSGNWGESQLTRSGKWVQNSIRSGAPSSGVCSGDEDDCRASRCCQTLGKTCYQKDEHWASCRDSCTPGINLDDPVEFQTPWSCVPLMQMSTRSACNPSPTPPTPSSPLPTPVPVSNPNPTPSPPSSPLPTPVPVSNPSPTPPPPSSSPNPDDCVQSSEDCTASRCCKDANMQCFEKDEHWAGCKESCTPGGWSGAHLTQSGSWIRESLRKFAG